jgi:hypothetical protein
MTTPSAATAEDFVALAASIDEIPTLEQLDSLITMLTDQPADVHKSSIMDGLLEMRFAMQTAP